MKNGLPVAGYRPQSEVSIEVVNDNKQIEELVLRRLDRLADCTDIDKRWLAIGRTAIEQGFMAVNRAVFQPERVAIVDEIQEMKVGDKFVYFARINGQWIDLAPYGNRLPE